MGLPAGVPALLVLGGTLLIGSICGYGFGSLFSYDALPPASRRARRNFCMFAISGLCIAPVFWAWALYNTVTHSFDFGVVTFFIATAAPIRGITVSASSDLQAIKCHRVIAVIACAFPCLNYVGALFLGLDTWLVIYMVAGALVWLSALV